MWAISRSNDDQITSSRTTSSPAGSVGLLLERGTAAVTMGMAQICILGQHEVSVTPEQDRLSDTPVHSSFRCGGPKGYKGPWAHSLLSHLTPSAIARVVRLRPGAQWLGLSASVLSGWKAAFVVCQFHSSGFLGEFLFPRAWAHPLREAEPEIFPSPGTGTCSLPQKLLIVPIPSRESQGPSNKRYSQEGGGGEHSPHVLTALSTPEGFPWITLSPSKAHWLIDFRSSSGHLSTQRVR